MSDVPSVKIVLQPAGVGAPAQRVVIIASQVVAKCLQALDLETPTAPEMRGGGISYQFRGLELSPEEWRCTYKNWVLAKGFQDLARGVRETLEEALFFLKMRVLRVQAPTTLETLDREMASIRKAASKLTFPILMEHVNAGLTEPMAFEAEFLTLQKVRNCLEHRGGRVSEKDVDPSTNFLTLSFPRLKTFYLRGLEEIEVRPGEVIDTHEPGGLLSEAGATIYIRRVTRVREYMKNDPVVIDAGDFYEIAMACHLFATDIVSKLPSKPENVE